MAGTKECVNENLIDFKSPSITSDKSYPNDNSPGSNPFDTLSGITGDNDPFLISGNFDPLDCGRESLGILQIDLGKVKFDDTNWLSVPEICVNNETTLQISSENSPHELNKAFLYSHKNIKVSTGSSIASSLSSLPESLELWDLSKIPSATSLMNTVNADSLSVLNNGFINSYNKSNLFAENVNDPNRFILKHLPTRIHSLPDVLEDQNNEDNRKISESRITNTYLKNFRKSESLFKRSFTLPQVLTNVAVEDNEFNDSVFIEAKHIASKIADDSILNLGEAELYSIDCTSPPDLIDITDPTDEENVISTEMVFKNVDKMIPSTGIATTSDKLPEINNKDKSTNDVPNKTTDSSNSSSSSLNRKDCIQNLSEIFSGDNQKLSKSRLSQCSSNKSKSHNANSILHNLSEILNNDHPSVQQKNEGQNLLFSLADILCSSDHRDSSNGQEQSEDSGHSSIDQDVLPANIQEDVNCSPLDLRINAETPIEQPKPLDLSMSKKMQQDDILDLSISKYKVLKVNNRSNNKNESATSNDSKNLSNMKGNITNLSSFGKLKPKRTETKVPEKGPLKAMIPIVNMAKSRGVTKPGRFSTTPTKSSHMPGYRIKRTSTPKIDSKPQPVAQSTPDGNLNTRKSIPTPTQLRHRRFDAPVSPLARTNSVTSTSTTEANIKNRSDSAPNLSASCNSKDASSLNNSSKIMFRRRSASDIKIGPDGSKFKRSNTIDKDSGIAKTLNRVRENIEKARNSSSTNGKLLGSMKNVQKKSILGEGNRILSPSNIKPCNLVNKLRSNGKENIYE